MKLPNGFKILAESERYILGHVYEYGSIYDKKSEKEIYIGDSYGDPRFGLIDKNEEWALLLGCDSYLWTSNEIVNLNDYIFGNEIFPQWAFGARQTGNFEIQVLDDPWGDNPGVYSFDINTKIIKRIRDFKKLDGPYYDYDEWKIIW